MIMRFLLALSAFALVGCGARGSTSDTVGENATPDSAAVASAHDVTSEPVIRLQRETCYGRCPAYVVELFVDGTVRFEPRQHVPVSGVQEAQVDAASVHSLQQQFEAAGFATADSAYVQESANCGQYFADGPQFTLSARTGAQRHEVHLDAGCTAAPRFLNTLAAAVDNVARIHTWVPTNGVPQ